MYPLLQAVHAHAALGHAGHLGLYLPCVKHGAGRIVAHEQGQYGAARAEVAHARGAAHCGEIGQQYAVRAKAEALSLLYYH